VRHFLSVVEGRKLLSLGHAPSRKRAQPTEVVKREGGAGLGQGPKDESLQSHPKHEPDNVSDDDDFDGNHDDDEDYEAGPQSKKPRLAEPKPDPERPEGQTWVLGWLRACAIPR
jgi:hypothetical protein